MRVYNASDIAYSEGKERGFIITNLNSISASIKSIITEVRLNRTNSSTNATNIQNNAVQEWTTALRPTTSPTKIVIGINTTTNKLNHTRDGGATWYNADGTAA